MGEGIPMVRETIISRPRPCHQRLGNCNAEQLTRHACSCDEYLNTSTDLVKFFPIANCSGVWPSVFLASRSAPLSTSSWILSLCCDDAAACNGVPRPIRLPAGYSRRQSTLMSIPMSSRCVIISTRPGLSCSSPAAECKASLSFRGAPYSSRRSKTAGVEFAAATSRIVEPGLPKELGSAPCSRNHRVSVSSPTTCLEMSVEVAHGKIGNGK